MIVLDRRFFLAASALTLPAAAWAAMSPKDMVEALYGKTDTNANWDQRVAQAMGRKKPFSRGFGATLASAEAKSKKNGEPWLDLDPISNSQDPSINGLAVTNASESAGTASIRAEFRYDTTPKSLVSHVFYDFTRENGQWALDNVRGLTVGKKGTGWSLRKLAEAV